MFKVISYLKPYSLGILFCLFLLFVQGFCELSLPNYMSNIVNVGIQQNGIESIAPEAMSENFYSIFNMFMSTPEKNIFEKSYQLIESNIKNNNYENYVKKYPLLEKENIYILSDNYLPDINSTFGAVCNTMINFFKHYFPNYNIPTNNLDDIEFAQIYKIKSQLQANAPLIADKIKNIPSHVNDDIAKQTSLYFIKNIYSELGLNMNKIQNDYIFKIGLIMLIFTIISSLASIFVNFLSSKIAAKTARNLRHDVFRKVESFSNSEFNTFSTASLITRTTNDITQIQTLFIASVRTLFYSPILAIGAFFMALNKSTSMYWTIFLGILILSVIILTIFLIVFPKFKLIQKLMDKLSLIAKENLKGIMVIRAFGTQKFEEKRFDIINKRLTQTDIFINKVMSFMKPSMMLLMNLVSILIIWTGSQQVEKSHMQVGDIIAFMQYATQIMMSFLMISFIFIMIPRAMVSAKRISEVLNTEPLIKDSFKTIKINKSKIKGKVEFKNVSFRYNDAKENVLENINFVAMPGQTTAFIGPTGSGKSTLINLIPRFFDVTDGNILIDGINIKDISQKDLHDIIGYVPQKGILFSGDVESNLRLGKENALNRDLNLAIEISQATEFINSNDEKLKLKISQNGNNVSGGQRQRLSIARAILKNSPIYIFDDSFSALDLKTDSALRKALYQHTKNNTILVVAQRISTIMDADQIVVLDDGKIVGIGTHNELIKNCKTYKEIALSQLPKEKII